MFYNKPNIALRTAYFFATSAISGAAGGLVSYGISFMDGTAGWRAWRWIILIVGIPTVVTGFVVPLVLPNSPELAKFLTAQDKQNLLLLREAEIGQTKSAQELHKDDVMTVTFQTGDREFGGAGNLDIDFWVWRTIRKIECEYK